MSKREIKIPCDCGHRSRGWKFKNFDQKMLEKGMYVEFEHTCDPAIALRISADHLTESTLYYELLEEMERKFKPNKKIHPKPIVTKKCKNKK